MSALRRIFTGLPPAYSEVPQRPEPAHTTVPTETLDLGDSTPSQVVQRDAKARLKFTSIAWTATASLVSIAVLVILYVRGDHMATIFDGMQVMEARMNSTFDDLILEPTRAVSVLNMQMSALLDHLATPGPTDSTSSTASISSPSVAFATLGPRAVTGLATARSMGLTTLSTMTTTLAPLTITVTLSRNDEASAATKTFPDLPLALLPPTTAAAGATSTAMSSVRTTLASSSSSTSSAMTAPTVTVIQVMTETVTARTTSMLTTTATGNTEPTRPTMSVLTLGSGAGHKAFNPLSPVFQMVRGR